MSTHKKMLSPSSSTVQQRLSVIPSSTRGTTTMSCYKSVLLTLIISSILSSSSVLATISVISELTNETVAIIQDQPARFIPDQDAIYDIKGYVIYADPPNACTPVKPPPVFPYPVHWILLARRYDCDFQTKIENAQNASYYAIIVHNVGLNSTAAMGVQDDSKLNIFAVFIGDYDGQLLRDEFSYPNRFYIRIQDDFSFNGYILPFAIVVGVCFVIVLLFMVRLLWQQCIRFLRERRRNRKRRLPASALKKLPTQKWTKGDPWETCAICIEDFVIADKIRVLPCSHGFHCECIDPWLTKGRRVCPICKRKVVLAEERFSDSDDSDDESETAPLLQASTSSAAPTAQSTFVQQRENPFRRAQRRMRDRHHLQQQQRGTVIQNSESSTENDEDDDDGADNDDEFDSSSEPNSASNASSNNHSQKSIHAEVHSSNNVSSSPESTSIQHSSHLNTFNSSQHPTLSAAVDNAEVVVVVGTEKKLKTLSSKPHHRHQQHVLVNSEAQNTIDMNENNPTSASEHVIISGSSSSNNNNNNPTNSNMQESSGLTSPEVLNESSNPNISRILQSNSNTNNAIV